MGIDVCIGGENQNEVILVDLAAMEWANAHALMKTHPRSTFPAPPPASRRTDRHRQRRPLDDDSVRTAPRGFLVCSTIAEAPDARPPPPQTCQAPYGARCFLAGTFFSLTFGGIWSQCTFWR